MIRRLALAALLVACFALPASASDAPDWAHRLPNELMSPFCPGVTLNECTSSQATQLRMWILVQAAAGASEEEVREQLYDRYGDQVRPAPKAEGIGIAAYVIPVVVFLAGGGVVGWFLRRVTRRAEEGPRTPVDLDPEVERKLDEVLGRDDDEVDGR